MDTAKHTPGPWHAHEGRASEIWACRGPIAMTIARAEDDGGEEEANARLIAAAPEMLAQLEALVVQIESLGLTAPPNVTTVIAKAKGVVNDTDKPDPGAPGTALEQRADMMTDEERMQWIADGMP